MNFHPTGPCLRIFPVHCEDLRFCLGHDCKHFQRKKTEPGGPGRGEGAVRRNWSFFCFCFTWDGEEGEDPQRNDAELCEGEVHADDVYQNLLGHVGGPEHHKAELEAGGRGKPGCKEKASTSGKKKPGILICQGTQREGDLPKQEAGIPVLRLPSPCPVLAAGTGPGPPATSAPQGPGQRGRCGRTEWGNGPLSGASGLPWKA